MNKKVLAGLLAVVMMLGLCACNTSENKLDGDGTAKTEPVETAAPDAAAETKAEEESAAASEPDFATMTPAEREAYIRATLPELSDELKTAIGETMNAILNINPGSAGSSLRQTAALGRVLDLAELAGTDTDRSAFTWACHDWVLAELKEASDKERLNEGYTRLFEAAGTYFTDPSTFSGEMEDCGYTYQHSEYNQELAYWVLDCIAISLAEGE